VDERLGTKAATSKRESHQQSSPFNVIGLVRTLHLLVAENWHKVCLALLWYRDQWITLLSAVKPTNYLSRITSFSICCTGRQGFWYTGATLYFIGLVCDSRYLTLQGLPG
jgi:hypothetical protein